MMNPFKNRRTAFDAVLVHLHTSTPLQHMHNADKAFRARNVQSMLTAGIHILGSMQGRDY